MQTSRENSLPPHLPVLILPKTQKADEMAAAAATIPDAEKGKVGSWWASLGEKKQESEMDKHERETVSEVAREGRDERHYVNIETAEKKVAGLAKEWDDGHPGQKALNPLIDLDGTLGQAAALASTEKVEGDGPPEDAEGASIALSSYDAQKESRPLAERTSKVRAAGDIAASVLPTGLWIRGCFQAIFTTNSRT